MGYYTSWTGQLELDPPLPFKAFKDSIFYPLSDADVAVIFHVITRTEETDVGTITIIEADAIEPADDDPMRAYQILDDVQGALDLLPPGTTVTGFLQGDGDDTYDAPRIYARQADGTWHAVQVDARTVYPLAAYGLAEHDAVIYGRQG